ncbi:MAG: hypothetical protein R3B91_15095 [Planctomycetaceae bacterium]
MNLNWWLRILELVREFPRFGYRRISPLAAGRRLQVNQNASIDCGDREGLKVPRKKRKRRRLGDASGGITRCKAERMNHVWSLDFALTGPSTVVR